MSDVDLSTRGLFSVRTILLKGLGVGAVILAANALQGRGIAVHLPTPHFHAPHIGLLLRASPAIRVHVLAALTALGTGLVLLAGVKGSAAHKRLGWAWVVAMVVTAATSLFIRVINPGHWSFIHFLSGWVLIALPMGVVAIRRKNVRLHRRLMTGLFIGGLVIAGAFTFAPGRLMWAVFFG